MEMRFFSSYVIKERNVLDRRLEDIYSGLDILMEGEKIKQEIFNYEHDLWSFWFVVNMMVIKRPDEFHPAFFNCLLYVNTMQVIEIGKVLFVTQNFANFM